MVFYVEDMSCSHCKETIEKSLSEAGARDCIVDVRTKTVRIQDNISPEIAKKAIRDAGYFPSIMNE